jgi:hypothetical protein
MTLQIPDQTKFENVLYDICDLLGGTLFSPQDYGLKAISWQTDCHRGYFCHFKISSNQLFLENLSIGFESEETIKAINNKELFGKLPEFGVWFSEYKNLNAPILYTGNLLLGNNYIHKLRSIGGFEPAWKYQKVLELCLEKGKVISVTDKSEQMKDERKERGFLI